MYILDKCIENFYSWKFAHITLLLSVIRVRISQLFPFIGLCYTAALFNRRKNFTMNNFIICCIFHCKKRGTSSYFLSLFSLSMHLPIKKPNQKLCFIFILPCIYITLTLLPQHQCLPVISVGISSHKLF